MTEPDQTLPAAAVRHVRAQTRRWSAHALVRPGRAAVELTHPVSAGLQFVFKQDAATDEWARFVDWMATDPEVVAVEACPEDLPHATLLRALRELAKGYALTNALCRDMSTKLEVAGCLSPDEAAWYARFTGEGAFGAPSPPGSR